MTTALAPTPSSPKDDGFVYLHADLALKEVLLSLCRRYKGIDPIVDAKIDAAASKIIGNAMVKTIPGERPGAPRVPLYFEGEPGVGKTIITRAGSRAFCDITGLNFVESPPDEYVLQPNDFYFVTVNLSGKNNVSDFGGLPMRAEAQAKAQLKKRRKAAEAGEIAIDEVKSRIFGAAGALGLQMGDVKEYESGGLDCLEINIKGDPTLAQRAVDVVFKQVAEDAKRAGVGLTALKSGADPDDDRVSYYSQFFQAGAKLTVYVPALAEDDVEYVASVLPNRRFAEAKKARFALINFDDVANANEQVRNVLLEVAQSNRYSGVMDIGNAVVTFSGNMGAEDNTNVMSRQSDAEVTRIRKFRVQDTPEDWAKRISVKYGGSAVGDCHFASFIHRQGNTPGIFREPAGAARGKRGVPKTNARALENAIAAVDGYFMMAKESGISVNSFLDVIQRDVSATAGKMVANSYHAHLQAMLTQALPLAEDLIRTGKLDETTFKKHAGQLLNTSEQDFAYRFGAALADSAVQAIAFQQVGPKETTPDRVETIVDRMCTGLAALPRTTSNYSLTILATRLAHLKGMGHDTNTGFVLDQDVYEAMAKGFGKSMARNIWGDAAQTKQAEDDFVSVVSGARKPASAPVAQKTKKAA